MSKAQDSSQPLLSLSGVTLRFAGVLALSDVSLQIMPRTVHAVIGPNGAGKTSLFNCISGVYTPQQGDVRLQGESLLRLRAHQIAARGVARMFQNLGLFENLTVLDNLLVGAHHGFQTRWWQDLLWTPATRRAEVRARALAEEIMDFLELAKYRAFPVGLLPYGVKKRVELGRALCMQPKLLLLDEPAAGLNQEETEELATFILDIGSELGVTQLLIEHELGLVMDLADRITVLDFGHVIADDVPQRVAADPRVQAAYTGRPMEDSGTASSADGATAPPANSQEAKA